MPNPLTTPITLPWDNALRGIAKAVTLAMPGPRNRGGYIGDPVAGGVWVDSSRWGTGWRGNGVFDYPRAVGDPSLNAVVWACLTAIAQAFPEPPIRCYRTGEDEGGEPEALPDRTTPAVRLLRRPNGEHTWAELAGLIVCHQHATDAGTAYLWKERSDAGRVTGLWPLEPDRVWPVPGETTRNYIRHYAYKADERQEPQAIPIRDIVKLTLIRDPSDPRKGRGPLRSALKHIFTDEEATAFLNATLKNYGVPAALASPATTSGVGGVPPPPLSPEAVAKLRSLWDALTQGDQRGRVLISPQALNVQQLSQDPRSMLLDVLQRTPEGRICAVMGVPPIVALQVLGLENATYSNADQFYEGFTKFKMVPYWRHTAEQLTHQLLPDFYGEDAGVLVQYGFDLDRVAALQEDENALGERVTKFWLAGIITLNESRRAIGQPETPDGDVHAIPSSVTITEPDNLIPEEPEPVPMLEAPETAGALPAPAPRTERRNGAVPATAGAQNGR